MRERERERERAVKTVVGWTFHIPGPTLLGRAVVVGTPGPSPLNRPHNFSLGI